MCPVFCCDSFLALSLPPPRWIRRGWPPFRCRIALAPFPAVAHEIEVPTNRVDHLNNELSQKIHQKTPLLLQRLSRGKSVEQRETHVGVLLLRLLLLGLLLGGLLGSGSGGTSSGRGGSTTTCKDGAGAAWVRRGSPLVSKSRAHDPPHVPAPTLVMKSSTDFFCASLANRGAQ